MVGAEEAALLEYLPQQLLLMGRPAGAPLWELETLSLPLASGLEKCPIFLARLIAGASFAD